MFVGIIDLGINNLTSVQRAFSVPLKSTDSLSVIEGESKIERPDLVILPGLGNFGAGMAALRERKLIEKIKKWNHDGTKVVGICLGMQLLANASYEHKYTVGLGLIPGDILPFVDHGGHIGWNTLEFSQNNSVWSESDGEAFYFNHSFCYQGPSEYQVAVTQHLIPFPSIIQCSNVVGLQFHPEKSQLAGKALLKNLIKGLVDA